MNLQELYGLMQKFEASSLTALEVEYDGGKVKLERGAAGMTSFALPQPATAANIAPASAPAFEPTPSLTGRVVTAPLVGVFYVAPAPGAEPYVKPGSRVKKGETLCLIEAMKVMNEVPAPADGIIRQVMAQNEQLVEYGTPLFEIEEQ